MAKAVLAGIAAMVVKRVMVRPNGRSAAPTPSDEAQTEVIGPTGLIAATSSGRSSINSSARAAPSGCGMGVSGSVDRYDLPEHVYR
jgi:hypothetical protein